MKFKSGTTLHDCLQQVHQALLDAELFYGHGTDNAWDEACWLLDAVLAQGGGAGGQVDLDSALSDASLEKAASLVERRIHERKPLAYLLNEAWFAGQPFHVDERVLVPRSPIAELIQNHFDPLLSQEPSSILDLCTGSGCIGIACALAFPAAKVDLSDLSADALEVARLNIARYQLESRVRALRSDLFGKLKGQRYDLIVCNPPYVSEEEYQELPEEYLREPRLGLVTEDQGLAIPTRILREAAQHLHDGGTLILEVGHSWQALAESLPQVPFLWLEFEHGGEGVCALTKAQLEAAFG